MNCKGLVPVYLAAENGAAAANIPESSLLPEADLAALQEGRALRDATRDFETQAQVVATMPPTWLPCSRR